MMEAHISSGKGSRWVLIKLDAKMSLQYGGKAWKVWDGALFYRKKARRSSRADSVTFLRKVSNIEPDLRYGFSSNRLYGRVDSGWSNTLPCPGLTFWFLEGVGMFFYQYNADRT